MDTLARSLLVADDMLQRGTLRQARDGRYAGWDQALGQEILEGGASLESLGARVAAGGIDPRPVSGRQEYLENLVNERIWASGNGTDTSGDD
jgi:xylose isomerase